MRLLGRWIGAFALIGISLASAPARAIEVFCVEPSRYKHIMRIFQNDASRFAAYFRVNANEAPPPDTCRALLVTGQVMKQERGQPNADFEKLAQAITAGRGWVTTLYLASPGGNIATGLRLGELTRMFWLNTYAVADGSLDYVPDFLGSGGPGSPASVPPELEAGYRDYQAATQGTTQLAMQERRSRRCVSSCTFLHAAGIYRYGEAHFHRGRRNAAASKEDSEPSMSELVNGLQVTENRVIAFYRKMDAGEAAVSAYQNTATETTLAAAIPLMPRYIADHLKKQCAAAARPSGQPAPPAELRRAMQRDFPTGFADIQCIAASNARERLLQYTKLCPSSCDLRDLYREAGKRIAALLPRERERDYDQRRSSGRRSTNSR